MPVLKRRGLKRLKKRNLIMRVMRGYYFHSAACDDLSSIRKKYTAVGRKVDFWGADCYIEEIRLSI